MLTELNLKGWLLVLAALGREEDADLYWVVRRGMRVLPMEWTSPPHTRGIMHHA